MTFERGDDIWISSLGFVILSIGVHLLLALLLPPLLPEPDETESSSPSSEESFEVGVVREPDPPDPPEKPPPETRPEPPEKNQEKRQQPRKREKLNRKTVDQQTNQKNPEEAEFLSNEANKVEEQTRARETTNQNRPAGRKTPGETESGPEVQSGASSPRAGLASKSSNSPSPRPPRKPEPPPPPRKSDDSQTKKPSESEPETPSRPAEKSPSPERAESSKSETSEESKPSPSRPRKPLPMPSSSDYNEIFENSSENAPSSRARAQKGVGHEMFQRMKQSQGSLKASLENYITEIKPGNHTAVNAKVDKAASYINTIHRKIHPRWGGDYLPSLAARFGPGHPLNNPDLNAELEFVVDGETGQLESVNIVESSGQTMFDSEAILIAKQVAPHPPPPDALVSPDGHVYLHWNFWRDQRQCGTFGVSVYRKRGGG